MSAVGRLADLVIDCPDPVELARFWRAVLGREVVEDDPGWVSLAPGADGHRLSFQLVSGYTAPSWPTQDHPQQMLLDVLVEDLDAAHEQVLALGARSCSALLDPGPKQWRIYLDPADHPFCLVTST